MAAKDFFVSFGSNAATFSNDLKGELDVALGHIKAFEDHLIGLGGRTNSSLAGVLSSAAGLGTGATGTGAATTGATTVETENVSAQFAAIARHAAQFNKETVAATSAMVGIVIAAETVQRKLKAAADEPITGGLTTTTGGKGGLTPIGQNAPSEKGTTTIGQNSKSDRSATVIGQNSGSTSRAQLTKDVAANLRNAPVSPKTTTTIGNTSKVMINEASFKRVVDSIEKNVTATKAVETAITKLSEAVGIKNGTITPPADEAKKSEGKGPKKPETKKPEQQKTDEAAQLAAQKDLDNARRRERAANRVLSTLPETGLTAAQEKTKQDALARVAESQAAATASRARLAALPSTSTAADASTRAALQADLRVAKDRVAQAEKVLAGLPAPKPEPTTPTRAATRATSKAQAIEDAKRAVADHEAASALIRKEMQNANRRAGTAHDTLTRFALLAESPAPPPAKKTPASPTKPRQPDDPGSTGIASVAYPNFGNQTEETATQQKAAAFLQKAQAAARLRLAAADKAVADGRAALKALKAPTAKQIALAAEVPPKPVQPSETAGKRAALLAQQAATRSDAEASLAAAHADVAKKQALLNALPSKPPVSPKPVVPIAGTGGGKPPVKETVDGKGGDGSRDILQRILTVLNAFHATVRGRKPTTKDAKDEEDKLAANTTTSSMRRAMPAPVQEYSTAAGRESVYTKAIAAFPHLESVIRGEDKVAAGTALIQTGYLKAAKAAAFFAAEAGKTGTAAEKWGKTFHGKLGASIGDASLNEGADAATRKAAAKQLKDDLAAARTDADARRLDTLRQAPILAQQKKDTVKTTANDAAAKKQDLADKSLAVTQERVSQTARDEIAALKALTSAGAADAAVTEKQVAVYQRLNAELKALAFSQGQRNRAIRNVFEQSGVPTSVKDMKGIAETASITGPGTLNAVQESTKLGANMGRGAVTGFAGIFGNTGFYGRMVHSVGTFLVRNLSATLVFGLGTALKDAIEQGVTTESTFVRVSQALEATERSSDGLRTSLQGLSEQYGVALKDVYTTAAGLTGLFNASDTGNKQLIGLTEVALQLELISGGALNATEAMKSLASVTSAYGGDSVKHIADVATTIQNRLGVNVEDTIEGVSRLSGEAKVMGISFQNAAVYVASISKFTGLTGAGAGEQFSRILQSLTTGKTQNVIQKALGAIKPGANGNPTAGPVDVSGLLAANDYDKVLQTLLIHYEELTEAQKANVATALGGSRQAATVNALFAGGTKVIDAQTAAMHSNGAAQDRASAITEQLNRQMLKLRAAFVNFFAVLVRSGALDIFGIVLKGLLATFSLLNNSISRFNDLTDSVPGFGALQHLLMIVGGVGVGFILARKAVEGFKTAIATMGGLSGFAAAAGGGAGAAGQAVAVGGRGVATAEEVALGAAVVGGRPGLVSRAWTGMATAATAARYGRASTLNPTRYTSVLPLRIDSLTPSAEYNTARNEAYAVEATRQRGAAAYAMAYPGGVQRRSPVPVNPTDYRARYRVPGVTADAARLSLRDAAIVASPLVVAPSRFGAVDARGVPTTRSARFWAARSTNFANSSARYTEQANQLRTAQMGPFLEGAAPRTSGALGIAAAERGAASTGAASNAMALFARNAALVNITLLAGVAALVVFAEGMNTLTDATKGEQTAYKSIHATAKKTPTNTSDAAVAADRFAAEVTKNKDRSTGFKGVSQFLISSTLGQLNSQEVRSPFEVRDRMRGTVSKSDWTAYDKVSATTADEFKNFKDRAKLHDLHPEDVTRAIKAQQKDIDDYEKKIHLSDLSAPQKDTLIATLEALRVRMAAKGDQWSAVAAGMNAIDVLTSDQIAGVGSMVSSLVGLGTSTQQQFQGLIAQYVGTLFGNKGAVGKDIALLSKGYTSTFTTLAPHHPGYVEPSAIGPGPIYTPAQAIATTEAQTLGPIAKVAKAWGVPVSKVTQTMMNDPTAKTQGTNYAYANWKPGITPAPQKNYPYASWKTSGNKTSTPAGPTKYADMTQQQQAAYDDAKVAATNAALAAKEALAAPVVKETRHNLTVKEKAAAGEKTLRDALRSAQATIDNDAGNDTKKATDTANAIVILGQLNQTVIARLQNAAADASAVAEHDRNTGNFTKVAADGIASLQALRASFKEGTITAPQFIAQRDAINSTIAQDAVKAATRADEMAKLQTRDPLQLALLEQHAANTAITTLGKSGQISKQKIAKATADKKAADATESKAKAAADASTANQNSSQIPQAYRDESVSYTAADVATLKQAKLDQKAAAIALTTLQDQKGATQADKDAAAARKYAADNAVVDTQNAAANAQLSANLDAGPRDSVSRAQNSTRLARQQQAQVMKKDHNDPKKYKHNADYWTATQAIQDGVYATQDAQSEFAIASLTTSLDKSTPVGDAVAQAKNKLTIAKTVQADAATRFGRNSAQYAQATMAVIDDQRAVNDSVDQVAESNSNLAIAMDTAAGNMVKAADDAARDAARLLRIALKKSGGKKTSDVQDARANSVTANAAARDAHLQDHLDTIDFNKQMGLASSAATIAQLQNILKQTDLTKAQRRSIMLEIHGLQQDLINTLTSTGFNIPGSIKMPTPYQVRRSIGLDNAQKVVKDSFADTTKAKNVNASTAVVPGAMTTSRTNADHLLAELKNVKHAIKANGSTKVTLNQDNKYNVPSAHVATQIANQIIAQINAATSLGLRANSSTPRQVQTR